MQPLILAEQTRQGVADFLGSGGHWGQTTISPDLLSIHRIKRCKGFLWIVLFKPNGVNKT
jgi:hypothetical protein